MPKIFDCFIFFKELELLEIRLNELDPVVDRFVLCESAITHSGKPKPLVFAENRDRFAPFLKKINHVVVDDMPYTASSSPAISNADRRTRGRRPAKWRANERFQRNAIRRGLSEARRDDFVILSDVDEIPRASTVEAVACRPGKPAVFSLAMDFNKYFLNVRLGKSIWNKARMARFGDIRTMEQLRGGGPTWRSSQHHFLTTLRQWNRMSFGMRRLRPWIAVPDAGWHFTSLNGAESVLDKLDSIAEFRGESGDAAAITEQIKRRLEDVSQPGERSHADLVEIDASFPSHLVANQSRFANLIADRHAFERYGVQPPKHLVTDH